MHNNNKELDLEHWILATPSGNWDYKIAQMHNKKIKKENWEKKFLKKSLKNIFILKKSLINFFKNNFEKKIPNL